MANIFLITSRSTWETNQQTDQNGETHTEYEGHRSLGGIPLLHTKDKELSISIHQFLLPNFQYNAAGCLTFLMPRLFKLYPSNCRQKQALSPLSWFRQVFVTTIEK